MKFGDRVLLATLTLAPSFIQQCNTTHLSIHPSAMRTSNTYLVVEKERERDGVWVATERLRPRYDGGTPSATAGRRSATACSVPGFLAFGAAR